MPSELNEVPEHHATDHRAVVANIPRELRARLLHRCDRPGVIRLTAHVGALIATGAAIVADAPFEPVLWVVHGILLVFLFTLMHEAIHRTAFHTNWANELIGTVCGFLLFLPAQHFRLFHFAHHRHTNEPEQDPELAVPKPDTLLEYVIHVTGVPTLWRQLVGLGRNAVGRNRDAFVTSAMARTVQWEAIGAIVGYAVCGGVSYLLSTTVLLEVWIGPLLLGQPFLRLYLLAEHGRCPLVANMLENTRTTFTNAAVRGLAWNMPYHAEHHCLPAVPFHQLPEFHRYLHRHLRQTERGYARFHGKYVGDLVGDGAVG